MSFRNDAPYARIVCYLSDKGILDAVRRGESVGHIVSHYLESDDEIWERFFEFHPQPVFYGEGAGDDPVIGADLVIGRPAKVAIVNRAPQEVGSFGFDYDNPPRVWHRPESTIEFGPREDAERLDVYLSPSELLDREAKARTRITREATEIAAKLPDILDRWRHWVKEDGLVSAHYVIDRVKAFDLDLLSYEQRDIIETAIEPLTTACDLVEHGVDDDESLEELMVLLPAALSAAQDADGQVFRATRRKEELEEANRWVSENGSPRLRKALAAGMLSKSLGAYRDERLGAERPGWAWSRQDEQFKDVVNPTETDLDALLAARKIDKYAALRFRTEDRTPVVTGQFLRRTIVTTTSALTESASQGYGYSEEPF